MGEVGLDGDHVRSFFLCPALECGDGALVTIDGVDASVRAEQMGEGAGKGAVARADVGPRAGVVGNCGVDQCDCFKSVR